MPDLRHRFRAVPEARVRSVGSLDLSADGSAPRPTGLLLFLALIPFALPFLWVVAPHVLGFDSFFSVLVAVAIAGCTAGLGVGVVLARDWSGPTRVRALLALSLLAFGTGGFLYFLKKSWVEVVRKQFVREKFLWQEFKPLDRSFTVRMPGLPEPAESPFADWTLDAIWVRKRTRTGRRYLVASSWTVPEKSEAFDETAWFDQVKQLIVPEDGRTLIGEKKSACRGSPATSFGSCSRTAGPIASSGSLSGEERRVPAPRRRGIPADGPRRREPVLQLVQPEQAGVLMPLPVRSLPVVQKWSCHGCSDCCRTYHVRVTDTERERIAKMDFLDHPGMAGVEPIVYDKKVKGYRLNHRADGACVLLDPDNKCRIHAKFGRAGKPIACRIYPFMLVPVGDHWRVGLRFACPSGRGTGEAAQEFGEESPLRRALRGGRRAGRRDVPPPLLKTAKRSPGPTCSGSRGACRPSWPTAPTG